MGKFSLKIVLHTQRALETNILVSLPGLSHGDTATVSVGRSYFGLLVTSAQGALVFFFVVV